MFEKATRQKLRFAFRGQSTIEDLWDLDAKSLDGIYQKLRAQQKEESGESLLTPARTNKELSLKVDIVKHIVTVKLEEEKTRKDRAKVRKRRRRVSEILAQKQDEALFGKSEEELQKLLKEMEEEE